MLTIAPSRFFPSPSFSWRLLFETTTEFPLREIHNITVQLLCWRGLKHPNVQVANSLLLLCKRLPTPTPKVGGIAPPFFDVPPFRLSRVHLAISSLIRINPTQGQVPAKSCKYWFIFTNMRISNPTTLRPTYFWHLQFPSIWTYKQHTKNISIPKPLVFHVVYSTVYPSNSTLIFSEHQVTSACSCHSPSCWKTRSAVGRSPTSVKGRIPLVVPGPGSRGTPKKGNPKPQKVGIYVGYHHHPQQSLERYIVRGTPVPWFIRRLSEYIR